MVFTDLIFTDVYLPLEQFFFMWLVIFYSIVCAVTSFHGFPYRAYRALYILNWAYRFLVEDNHHYHWIRKFWVLLHIDFILFSIFKFYILHENIINMLLSNAKHSLDFGPGSDCSICWFFLLLLQEVHFPCYISTVRLFRGNQLFHGSLFWEPTFWIFAYSLTLLLILSQLEESGEASAPCLKLDILHLNFH